MSNLDSLVLYLPELLLVAAILLTIVFDLISGLRKWSYLISLLGLVCTGLLLYANSGTHSSLFMDMIAIDPFSHFFKWIFLIAGFLTILVSRYTRQLVEVNLAEYNALLLIVVFGLFLMVTATNLITVYLGIETVSIPSYILAGMLKSDRKSNEASLKYVIFGAFASGLMLYGFSWLYGLAGSTNLVEIQNALVSVDKNLVVYMSIILVLVGIGYKLSMVPFHYWTPDVYEGAPTPITAFLSVAPKAAGFALLIRFFYTTFSAGGVMPIAGVDWPTLIALLSAITMSVGNLIAIQQDNVKRMLAYSSIAHAGYMLMAFTILGNEAKTAIMMYLVIYLFMNLGAFYMVIFAENKLDAHTFDDWKGLGYKAPLLSVMMTMLLISLTGLPPSAGFIGKLYLFAAIIGAKQFYWLAVIGVLNSVISLFYYFRIAKSMWLHTEEDKTPVRAHPVVTTIIVLLTIPTLLLGLYWTPLYNFVQNSLSF
ncbi:MAG: NADH-quinone oxidoreductase subunit N [FCB group bacterium]|nr:NADH-quinone oxidoreductase subunit N [FCB group bacterium]